MKKTTTILAAFFFCSLLMPLQAQFSFLGGLEYNLMSGGYSTPSFTIGGMGGIKDGEMGVFGKVSFFFPKKFSYEETAYAYSSLTVPQSVSVTADWKVGFTIIAIGTRRYFGDGAVGDGGLYGIGAISLMLAKAKYSYSAYDQALYDGPADITSETYVDAFAHIGIGYDLSLSDQLFLSFELPLAISFAGVNSREGSASSFPIILSPGVGLRFMLN